MDPELRHELTLHKSLPEVFRPYGQRERVTEATTDKTRAAIGIELVCLPAPLPTSTPPTFNAATATLGVESTKTSSTCHNPYSMHSNQAITATLKQYMSLHAHIDDIEARFNERLKDLTMKNLEKLMGQLKNAQDDIAKLQQERQNQDSNSSI
ncbi:hypothetical protein HAX54_046642 [Datura stramonium]|uniref:Uncharacterized protein n=1 Tax=Datura stramonium TaxID=4076 RepID=A0ABS8WJU7_DATST|nr:hypothetical protein [Datura stramonium]